MSQLSLKPFNDAFNTASKKGAALTEGHKEQLDQLQTIVDAINAEGTFKASLGKWVGDVPGLHVGLKNDQYPVGFQISFGHDSFGGTPTLKLSYTAARTPVGKAEGYSLQYASDRDAFLKDLGKEVALRRNQNDLAADALKYATRKKNAPTA